GGPDTVAMVHQGGKSYFVEFTSLSGTTVAAQRRCAPIRRGRRDRMLFAHRGEMAAASSITRR
ncbi:MAG: hypothetical protein ACHQ4H_10855, partial [Ktedonobacterales bacterium]